MDIPQVTPEENEFIITSPFIEKEIWDVVSDMEHNKAPRPYGFLAEFLQKFWEIIKGDIPYMF